MEEHFADIKQSLVTGLCKALMKYDIIFCNPDETTNCFAKTINYSIIINHRVINGKTNVVQTWIIDLYYDLVASEDYGDREISKDETVHLISLYNDFLMLGIKS